MLSHYAYRVATLGAWLLILATVVWFGKDLV